MLGFDCIYGLTGWEGAVRNRTDVKFYLYFGRGTSRSAGGTPVEFWNIVHGASPRQTCTWLHAFRRGG